jgi:hypothetical protein
VIVPVSKKPSPPSEKPPQTAWTPDRKLGVRSRTEMTGRLNG